MDPKTLSEEILDEDWCKEEEKLLLESPWRYGQIIEAKQDSFSKKVISCLEESNMRYDGVVSSLDLDDSQEADVPAFPEGHVVQGDFKNREGNPIRLQAVYQRRAGFCSTFGGRKRLKTDVVRTEFKNRAASSISNRLLSISEGAKQASQEIIKHIILLLKDLPSCSEEYTFFESKTEAELSNFSNFAQKFLETTSSGSKKGIEVIQAPIIAICSKFRSEAFPLNVQGEPCRVRERHLACTWIDSQGFIRCTCIGMTDFSIYVEAKGFRHDCCGHARDVRDFLESLSRAVSGENHVISHQIVGKAINNVLKEQFASLYEYFNENLPILSHTHANQSGVLCRLDSMEMNELQFIPFRYVQRTKKRICCFCDLERTSSCEHVMEANSAELHGGEIRCDENHCKLPSGNSWDPMDDIRGVSHLPLSIVNCPESIKRDFEVSQLCRNGESFVLKAPLNCSQCDSPRVEERKSIHHGVLMCSHGPCKMISEEYVCSNSQCNVTIHAEGRDDFIFLRSLSSGATHYILRRLLIGVVLGNGTLSGRIGEYHSKFTANIIARLIPGLEINNQLSESIGDPILPPTETDARPESHASKGVPEEETTPMMTNIENIQGPIFAPLGNSEQRLTQTSNTSYEDALISGSGNTQTDARPDVDAGILKQQRKWRSTRLIQDMCKSMCKLMVVNPPKLLFQCETCEKNAERIHAICCDGIWAGYKRSTQRKFENFTQSISAPPKSNRPLQGLFRQSQTSSILLNALRGKCFKITKRSLASAVAVIRVCGKHIVPADFQNESICGENGNDFIEDTGDCILKRTQEFVSFLFDTHKICVRVVQELINHMRPFASPAGGGSVNSLNQVSTESMAYQSLCEFRGYNHEAHDGEACVAWNAEYSPETLKLYASVFRSLLTFVRALLMGPLNQMVLHPQVDELERVGNACGEGPDNLLHILKAKNGISTSLLSQRRLIRGGLLSAVRIDAVRPGLLKRLSGIIHDCVYRLRAYHEYFESLPSTIPIIKYWEEWGSTEKEVLLRKVEERSNISPSGQDKITNCFESACRSGFFFPANPQVRPLPFNQDQMRNYRADGLGSCSKNYLQKTKAFTPGALTFCCSCSHPVIFGFKVLEKHEGPKAVLDVLVTRFAKPALHVVYDFVCSLFAVAAYTLWWGLRRTTFVCDAFHAYNHCCSPNFIPVYHDSLNMSNTVSHEQRNRPIKDIVRSLRSSSLDFYVALLAYHSCILNLKATGKKMKKYNDRPLGMTRNDLEWLYFDILELPCACCAKNSERHHETESKKNIPLQIKE